MGKVMIGNYEASIYREGTGWTGAISLGFDSTGKRLRPKRKGRTKAEVKDKLKELVEDLETGIEAAANYTIGDAVRDFLEKGLKGRSPSTVANYASLANHHIIPQIGGKKLKQLTADQLDDWLDERAEELSTRSLRLIHQLIERAIQHAQARDKVRRNVASLISIPDGQEGRPSRAMTLEEATRLLETVESTRDNRLSAYVIVSLLAGIRTEEARALTWSEVDLKSGTIAVYRSVRGDTKTRKSRRVLQLPKKATTALRRHHTRQAAQKLKAGEAWQDNNLVFCRGSGTPLDRWTVLREFQKITKRAGLGEDWTPRELRHSFVSILSAHDVRLEDISSLVGHGSTHVTETVYRHEIRPALTKGAEAMDKIFTKRTTSA